MFNGRYGNDQLNQALGICGLIFVALNFVLGIFFPQGVYRQILNLLWLACLALMLFRMFSRNFEARQKENIRFAKFWQNVTRKYGARHAGPHAPRAKKAKSRPSFEERRNYKYFYCTQCSQHLRVPRGKGKLRVTCARCGNRFEIKS